MPGVTATTSAPGRQDRAGALGGAREGLGGQPRVDGVVVGHVEREAHGRGQRGLGAARRDGRRRSTRSPKRWRSASSRSSASASSRSRATSSVPWVRRSIPVPAASSSSAAKAGQRAALCSPSAQQRLLAGVGLADRREHPGRHARGAGAELAAVEHAHAQAARLRAPGDGEADEAAADDGDVEHLSCVGDRFAPRFAGMTRISC